MNSLMIGKENNNKSIFWPFASDIMENRNCIYTGDTGSGKTYSLKYNMLKAYELGISVLVLDYTGSFTSDKLEREFRNKLGKDLHRRVVYTEGAGIYPFKRLTIDLDTGKIEEKPSDTADRIVDILARIFNLKSRQKAILYSCIIKGLDKKVGSFNINNEYYNSLQFINNEVNMDFNLLRYLLIETENPVAESVLSKLSSMIDKEIFSGDKLLWEKVIYGRPTITIIDLSGFSIDNQRLIVELLLWDLWYFTYKNGSENKPFIAVFDECQNLNHKKDSPTAKILTEGRKFGWSSWFCTQFLGGQFDADELRRLQQVSLRFYFEPPLSDVKCIARLIGDDITQNIKALKDLTKGECLVQGTIETESGKIYTNALLYLSIPSMNE